MTDSAIFSGTSTSENRSAIWIEPTSRGLTFASLTMAPTRSPGRTPAARPAPTKRVVDLYFVAGLVARCGGGAAIAGISCSSATEPEPAAEGSAIFTAAAATSIGSNSSARDSTTTR